MFNDPLRLVIAGSQLKVSILHLITCLLKHVRKYKKHAGNVVS